MPKIKQIILFRKIVYIQYRIAGRCVVKFPYARSMKCKLDTIKQQLAVDVLYW